MTTDAALPRERAEFDPLIDLYGVWTPELADRYLPIHGMPPVKYECLNGKLLVSPHLGAANSHPACTIVARLRPPARDRGGGAYTTLNIRLAPDSWMQPDFAVLREPAGDQVWIPAHQVLLAGECGPPSTRRADRIDKPARCAEAGVEFFMRAEISYAQPHAQVSLLRLKDTGYEVHVEASAGARFETEIPFPISFDPAELLEE
ncbi:hypothetical protein GCM10027271_11660 [Saccharopolyspora gloriosae]|uniref:Putative restriction endonuclease domain-containing protein n=1 Tax=Saccharopolyspora gloriosae TaxID=455344 RepID=A0A840NJH2_9PSEU|nr:Uma2 family endonuclease [Saccharopolyspora gloriosae]MBB5072706.1 hypothetical protein [Saccharopolyspora gloriosae]